MSFSDPNNFLLSSDSKNIQAAIDLSVKEGHGHVVIPACNKRTGEHIWIIDETIKLPSHICVEIDNAHLRMAEGVMCRMFENENADLEIGKTAAGLQEDITIQGRGNAILDGGKHNGLREDTHNKNGLPNIFHNITIYLHNVRNFKIDGLIISDQRFWAVTFMFSSYGAVSNIHFEITDKAWRKGHPLNPEHPWRNQDGIDLRVGCHDIELFNITGETGDDTIALTALAEKGKKPDRYEDMYYCHHLSPDIYNVSIRNVKAFNNHCAVVRLLCHFGIKLYNISMDDIWDATPDENPIAVADGQRTACCVKIGENAYFGNDPEQCCKHGQMRNIKINNIYSSGLSAVNMNCTVCDVEIHNIQVGEKGIHAVSASFITSGRHNALDKDSNITRLENVLVDGVLWNSKQPDAVPFFFNNLLAKNVRIINVSANCEKLVESCQVRSDSEAVIWS